MLLETQGLCKFFGTKLVFRDLDMWADRGEIVLVLGENGSGKSTLLRILAGLMRQSSGKAHVGVVPGKIGYMGHHSCAYPGMSAWENLRFWARIHGSPDFRERAGQILQRLGLYRARHEPVGTFSRGMAQRLNLARVLLLSPWLYLLDEPSSGLDRPAQELLHQQLSKLRSRGCAVIWVSHQPERDMGMADRVLNLQGRSGSMETLSPESAEAGVVRD